MNTEYFRYLLTIAEYQSISRAADALCLQRSYLSKVVQNIEQELEVTLFARSPKGILVTEEGQYALDQLQQILDILDDIKEHNLSMKKKVYPDYYDEVTVFAPPKVRPRKRSASYLPAFQEKFPHVTISMIEMSVGEMIQAVQTTPLSIAFVSRHSGWESLHDPIPDDLVFYPVTKEPIVALAAPNNVIAQEYQTMTLASLAKQDLVLLDFSIRQNSFLEHLLKPYEPLKIRYKVSNLTMFYQLMHANPYFSIGIHSDDINDDLLQIPLRDNLFVEQGILYRKDSLDNIVGKNLIELVLASYKTIH